MPDVLRRDVDSSSSSLLPSTSPPSSWRLLLARTLETSEWHWAIIAFSLVDFAFVLAEIVADYVDVVDDDCTALCLADSPLLELLDWLSLFITGLFVVEIPLNVLAFGFGFYSTVRHWRLHIFDALVVVGAFALEAGAQGPPANLASLLIVLMLWRVIKLFDTVESGIDEYDEVKKPDRST
ncbi:hypothetical protein JCM10212_000961 [Sporobolomyces blumeae]